MDLTTNYLGLQLPHPLMPGASPLVDDLDTVRQLEDAGAAAIVMHSLFEEQIETESQSMLRDVETHRESFSEALSYLPEPADFSLGPHEYLEQIRRVKEAVDIPVIASLNGVTDSAWLDYATYMEQAGADALELNVYFLASDPRESSEEIETRITRMVRTIKESVAIPVAVKLSPFFTSLVHVAMQLESVGADGLVIFNRFYQPVIDIEELDVKRALTLSDPSELNLRLRYLAILSANVKMSLGVTGGVHTALNAIAAMMTGAHAVQMVSALLRQGPGHLARVRKDLEYWLEEHEYQSLEELRGCMNLERCPDPDGYERTNYTQILQTWRTAIR